MSENRIKKAREEAGLTQEDVFNLLKDQSYLDELIENFYVEKNMKKEDTWNSLVHN